MPFSMGKPSISMVDFQRCNCCSQTTLMVSLRAAAILVCNCRIACRTLFTLLFYRNCCTLYYNTNMCTTLKHICTKYECKHSDCTEQFTLPYLLQITIVVLQLLNRDYVPCLLLWVLGALATCPFLFEGALAPAQLARCASGEHEQLVVVSSTVTLSYGCCTRWCDEWQ